MKRSTVAALTAGILVISVSASRSPAASCTSSPATTRRFQEGSTSRFPVPGQKPPVTLIEVAFDLLKYQPQQPGPARRHVLPNLGSRPNPVTARQAPPQLHDSAVREFLRPARGRTGPTLRSSITQIQHGELHRSRSALDQRHPEQQSPTSCTIRVAGGGDSARPSRAKARSPVRGKPALRIPRSESHILRRIDNPIPDARKSLRQGESVGADGDISPGRAFGQGYEIPEIAIRRPDLEIDADLAD